MCERLNYIKERVAVAAKRSGRDASDITIVAVSKKKPSFMIRALYDCGQRIFGENYIQEAISKIEQLSDIKDIQWHFIGHLQRNKVKYAVRWFNWIETVDSFKLAKALDRKAKELDRRIKILVQVNIADEQSKYGMTPKEVPALLDELDSLSNLEFKGLMTIHPFSSTPEDARQWFKKMVQLRDDLSNSYPHLDFSELSMGMSSDFEIAIEEGATIVRIGTALFGPRI